MSTPSVGPVFIWAPTQRCGSGLLQRLVTSSGEALIFGEEDYLTLQIPAQILRCDQEERRNAAELSRLAAGDPDGWYTHAYPPADRYRAVLLQNFQAITHLFAETARAHGFVRWGTKYPGFHHREALLLAELLPESRHLFLYRDIAAVLRSVKGRGWLRSPQDAAAYTQHWVHRVTLAHKHLAGHPRFQIVRYEDLTAQPAALLPELTTFLGVQRLDARVLAHRPNAPGGAYQPPQDLSPAEAAVLAPLARLRVALGYPEKLRIAA